MSNSTVPAAATGLPNDEAYSPEWRDARKLAAANHFEQLYSNWLTARGDRANPSHPDDDEGATLRSDREDECARLLFIATAVVPWMVWRKMEVFDIYLSDGANIGEWADRRQIAFWGCIKADLARLGVGNGD
jgi:hypothetical protein